MADVAPWYVVDNMLATIRYWKWKEKDAELLIDVIRIHTEKVEEENDG